MLTEAKKSPVMNYEAISYEEQYWYLPSEASHWRAKQKKPGSPWLLCQDKETDHLPLTSSAFSGGKMMLVVIIMSRLSCKACSHLLSDLLFPGILHEVGIMNIMVSRRGN